MLNADTRRERTGECPVLHTRVSGIFSAISPEARLAVQ